MRVAVVSEFYPRAEDPVLGVWAHRQAVAARDAGADLEVFVLHRVVPSEAELRSGPLVAAASLRRKLAQPSSVVLDGVPVHYVNFVSPPRGVSYGTWGRWAARRLRRLVGESQFDLVHTHNAIPAGDASRGLGLPIIVSVHGGDVFHTVHRWPDRVRGVLAASSRVVANTAGVAELARAAGAADPGVLRLGTDLPDGVVEGDGRTIVTVGHLVGRKRHDDVIRALPDGVRYEIVGDGPERARLEQLAAEHRADVVFHGQLPNEAALKVARRADVFVMPSTEEAFGVAYVEAMAGGLPAIGRRGEPGPEEIASLGGGMLLVDDGDLRPTIDRALRERDALGAQARATVEAHYTWERCGRATLALYADVAMSGVGRGRSPLR